jgi:predicted nucleic acid-binding Zn ribbon protein
MPKYLFRCKQCGQSETVEARTGSEAEVPVCCDVEMQRVWGLSFQLKGEGWSWVPSDEKPTDTLTPKRTKK